MKHKMHENTVVIISLRMQSDYVEVVEGAAQFGVNHDSVCCVVILILYIQIYLLIFYVLWI